jgi:hypothetical protein
MIAFNKSYATGINVFGIKETNSFIGTYRTNSDNSDLISASYNDYVSYDSVNKTFTITTSEDGKSYNNKGYLYIYIMIIS